MRQLINTIESWRKRTNAPQCTPNVIRPEKPFYAIGDIHGRIDLLTALLAKIDPDDKEQLVFLGDYVDRGPESAKVLQMLYDLAVRRGDQTVCLLGNHEKMMREFIDDPLGRGLRWLGNGGIDTLQSYGITGITSQSDPDDIMQACENLEAALPKGLYQWLNALPLQWNSGNMWCAHAAMDPRRPPDAQDPRILLWGQAAFLDRARDDTVCVIHGHTIVDTPVCQNSRIAIDTGAYRSGQLTAVYITDDKCIFTST